MQPVSQARSNLGRGHLRTQLDCPSAERYSPLCQLTARAMKRHRSNPKPAQVYDLTSFLDSAVAAYGSEATRVLRTGCTRDGLQRMSSICICPHSITHVDRLVWQDRYRRYLGSPSSREAGSQAAGRESHTSPIQGFACVVIDLADYARRMNQAMKKAGMDDLPAHHRYCWQEGQFEGLLKEMAIPKSELAFLSELKPQAVVFRTGWQRFAPKDADLRDPTWIPWHPYLLHPHLSIEAIDFLLSMDPPIRIIGCDMYGLDSPLRYVPHRDGKPMLDLLAQEVKNVWTRAEEGRLDADQDSPHWFLHDRALERNVLLIEQLSVPAEIFASEFVVPSALPRRTRAAISTASDKMGVAVGQMLVMSYPFGAGEEADAEPVAAFFSLGS